MHPQRPTQIVFTLASLLAFTSTTHAADLKVSAAANLQKVLTEALIPAFQKSTGNTVTPTFGATKQLAAQLQQGLPADVFLSADTSTVTSLVTDGTLDGQTQHVYAIGHLVIWSRKDAKMHPKRIQDLQNPAYARIAFANPATAPYGLAAQQSLAQASLIASVTPRLVQAENIGQTLQYAQSGNADVALTALSLVIEDKDDPYVVVPDKLHAPIAQSAACVKSSTQAALALQFINYLTGKDASKIWKKYGYSVPPNH